jgi:membrane-associated phospholipid phosphatase
MHQLRSPAARWAFLLAIEVVLVVALGLVVTSSSGWTSWENGLVISVNAASAPAADAVALAINVLFAPLCAAAITLAVVVIVGLRARSWRAAARVAILIVVPWGLTDALKVVVMRPRPDAALLAHVLVAEPGTLSYPSGHTAFAAALASALVLVAARRHRVAAACAAVVAVAITAWSRLYLGVHFPTDVLAAMLLPPVAAIAVHETLDVVPFLRGGPARVASPLRADADPPRRA